VTVASAGIRKTPTGRYKVWWRLDDASQGSQSFDTRDQARDFKHDLLARLARGSWVDPRLGKQVFETWACEWWEVWSTDPDRSPATLQATEGRLRRYLLPFFGQRHLRGITVSLVRRWQNELRGTVGHDTVMACRSVLNRILQAAEDDRRIDANPVRKVPAPKPPVDPAALLGRAKRRTYSPEEFWWDHVTAFLGTGLRFGELAGLRRRRIHLDRAVPVLQVGPTRYQAGRFGSGFKPRPKSDAGIREVPLAPLVVEAIRRQLPPGNDPGALVFTGPGGGGGGHGGPGVPKGSRTVLSRHNFRRTHHAAVAKLADPATELRPTAARVLKVLRARGPLTPGQLAAYLAEHGRAVRAVTVLHALGELRAAGLAVADGQAGCWKATPSRPDPLLEAVDLHGAHDFRHTFATWLEDAGIPARVIDEVMGHEATSRTGQRGSAMGAHYRHTTTEMAARVAAAVQERLTVVLQVADQILEDRPNRVTLRVV
jgi:integrase